MAALQNHPGMLLRPEHFAAFRINWQDKAQNLREIAAELNLGIDSIAFFDDNPVERELVRIRSAGSESHRGSRPRAGIRASAARLPVLRAAHAFGGGPRKNQAISRAAQARRNSRRTAGSLEDFFRSLEQEVVIAQRDAGFDRARRAADAKNQPVQRHHAALHRTADRGICFAAGLRSLFGAA